MTAGHLDSGRQDDLLADIAALQAVVDIRDVTEWCDDAGRKASPPPCQRPSIRYRAGFFQPGNAEFPGLSAVWRCNNGASWKMERPTTA